MALILQAQAERSSRPSPGTDKGDNAPPHRFILHRATKKGLCLTEQPPRTQFSCSDWLKP